MLHHKKRAQIEFLIFLLTIIFLSYITIITFYPEGYIIEGYDTSFHLERFRALHEAIKKNNYPYFIDNFIFDGYGYGTSLFYPDLILLPFTFFIDHVGLINSYKILLFTYTILSGILAFVCITKVVKNRYAGYLFAILYTFALYRFTNMVVRGALAEMLAFTFIPCIFISLWEVLYGKYKKYWYILSISFALLLLTHLITFLLVSIFCCIYILFYFIQKKKIEINNRFYYLIFTGLLVMLLCSIFIFPLLEQILNDSFYYKTNPAFPLISDEAIPPRWALDSLLGGLVIGSYRIPDVGIIITIPLLIRLFIRKRNNIIKIADISCIIGLILLFACTTLFPWSIFPFNKLSIIQFPWRFSVFITFFFAFSSCIYLTYLIPNKTRFYILYLSIISIIFYQIKILNVNFINSKFPIVHKLDEYQILAFEHSAGTGEYIPASVPSKEYLKERGPETITSTTPIEINSFTRNDTELTFNLETQPNSVNSLVLPLLYYKGYKADLNDREIDLRQSKDGLVEITFSGSGKIKVWYAGTTIQRISYLISIISLVGLIIYLIFKNRINRSKK